jgi:hypothetical protein
MSKEHFNNKRKGYEVFSSRPQVSNSSNNSRFLFHIGSSIDWVKAKEKIINVFKAADCYELIFYPPDLLPIAPGDDYVEYKITEKEPDINFVNIKMNEYNTTIQKIHDDKLAALNNLAPGVMSQNDTEKLIYTLGNHLIDHQGKRHDKTQEFERDYNHRVNYWKIQMSNYNIKVAACIRIFNECISPSALSVVKGLLNDNKFRKAWVVLNENLSANNGGIDSQTAVMDIVTKITWNGRDFNNHLNQMNMLFDQCDEADFKLSDRLKYQYFIKSIQRSSNNIFEKIIDQFSYMDEADRNLPRLINAMQIKTSAVEIENISKSFDRSNNNNNNSNNKQNNKVLTISNEENNNSKKIKVNDSNNKSNSSLNMQVNKLSINNPNKDHTCTICNKKGHLESKCFTQLECPKCGEIGHPEYLCDRMSKSVKKNVQIDGKVSNKVNLKTNFLNKHPKKKD